MKVVVFFQTPFDRIKYITDEMEDYSSMTYHDFLKFILGFKIENRIDFKKEIDCFKTIRLDVSSGKWIIIEPKKDVATMEELIKCNEDIVDESRRERNLRVSKSFVDKVIDFYKIKG